MHHFSMGGRHREGGRGEGGGGGGGGREGARRVIREGGLFPRLSLKMLFCSALSVYSSGILPTAPLLV